jgi:hypothetical protein
MDKKRRKRKINNINWMPIRTTETTLYFSKKQNWKSPGSDQIPNYWLKAFTATHSYITKNLQHDNRRA